MSNKTADKIVEVMLAGRTVQSGSSEIAEQTIAASHFGGGILRRRGTQPPGHYEKYLVLKHGRILSQLQMLVLIDPFPKRQLSHAQRLYPPPVDRLFRRVRRTFKTGPQDVF